jgi:DNA-binding XRE family transcriptional regulator
MTRTPSTSTRRKPAAIRRSLEAAELKKDSATPAEPGLVEQMRAMAGNLLEISSATGGRRASTGDRRQGHRGLCSDGQADRCRQRTRARRCLPSIAEPACLGRRPVRSIRAMRETAGLTIAEVGAAIDLKDPSLIEALENGRIALSFELILRLAAVFGRNDPIGFIMHLYPQFESRPVEDP